MLLISCILEVVAKNLYFLNTKTNYKGRLKVIKCITYVGRKQMLSMDWLQMIEYSNIVNL
jgi:hypothetical protein